MLATRKRCQIGSEY